MSCKPSRWQVSARIVGNDGLPIRWSRAPLMVSKKRRSLRPAGPQTVRSLCRLAIVGEIVFLLVGASLSIIVGNRPTRQTPVQRSGSTRSSKQ